MLDTIDDPYFLSLDGNEQYDDVDGVLDLLAAMAVDDRLARLRRSILFVEQPIKRAVALDRDAPRWPRASR